MKAKDFKAFLFCIIFALVLWQLGETIKTIFLKESSFQLNNALFSVIYAQNTGGAFSILQNQSLILAIFGIFVVLFLLWYVYKYISLNDKIPLLSISIFLGGSVGNILERIQFGYVKDYIHLNFIDFPTFNIFDVMICTGVVLYCLFLIYTEIFKKHE